MIMKTKLILYLLAITLLFPVQGYSQEMSDYEEFLGSKVLNNGTPLMYEILKGTSIETIRSLIKKGADVNAVGETETCNGVFEKDWKKISVLMLAARSDSKPEVLKILIEAGADVNKSDREKMTALMYAAQNAEKTASINVLLNAGANIYAKNKGGINPLMFALSREHENIDIVKTLIDVARGEGTLKEYVNETDKYGASVLSYAARFSKNGETFDLLLSCGADAKTMDAFGGMAADYIADTFKGTSGLQIAARDSPAHVVLALIEEGADVRYGELWGESPIMLAAQSNPDPEVIRALVKAGANVNVRSRPADGRTPLMYAMYLNPKVVDVLIELGADTYMTDELGRAVSEFENFAPHGWED